MPGWAGSNLGVGGDGLLLVDVYVRVVARWTFRNTRYEAPFIDRANELLLPECASNKV